MKYPLMKCIWLNYSASTKRSRDHILTPIPAAVSCRTAATPPTIEPIATLLLSSSARQEYTETMGFVQKTKPLYQG